LTFAAFVTAVLALLLAPGPTNTLIAVAGAQRGVRYALRLIPVELAGYLTTVLPLVIVGTKVLDGVPSLALAVQLAAAAWVMLIAIRLWSPWRFNGTHSEVTARQVFVTTMLNPKALVFGFVLIPAPGSPEFLLRLALFCAMVVGAALVWGLGGGLMRELAGGIRLQLIQRVASVWLMVVSVTLAVGAIPG
jgi:threonine/homoserine/homoserine lactone efflux protein